MGEFRRTLKQVSDSALLEEARVFANKLVKDGVKENEPVADLIRELCDRVEKKN